MGSCAGIPGVPSDDPAVRVGPFWQSLHDDRGLSSGVTGRRRPLDRRRGATLGAVFVGRADAFQTSPKQKGSEGENKTSENGARTHDENIFSAAAASGTRFAKASSARFSAALCEIFATLWIFLNRTAIQH